MEWNAQQSPGGPYPQYPYGQYPYGNPFVVQPPAPQVPPQVLVAFRLLDGLDRKQQPVIAVNDISIENFERHDLLPVEEQARATALHLLMAYMRSALQ